jgi:Phage tail assembly chaperone protein
VADTKVVIDCSAYGGPSEEHAAALEAEALVAMQSNDLAAAANLIEQAKAARELSSVPAVTEVELTDEELKQREADAEQSKEFQRIAAHAQRDGLLAASDWTQLPDAGVTEEKREEWKAYRQTLRDLDYSDPDSIEWPQVP